MSEEEKILELARLKENLDKAQKEYDDFLKDLEDESIGGGIKNPKG